MNKKEADYQIFNVGSGSPIAIKKMAEMLIGLNKKSLWPEVTDKYRKGDIRHCFADISKIKRVLNFEPKVSLEKGMAELVEWSRNEKAKDGFEKARRELKKKGLL
jgi:dTDP-L-rhamnose 4-epimerase